MEIINQNSNNLQGKWVRCKKKSYVIKACRNQAIKEVYNTLERSNVVVRPSEIILCGLLGEQWAIAESKFLARYTHTDGTPLVDVVANGDFDWIEVQTKDSDDVYFAMCIPKSRECAIMGMPTDNDAEALYHNDLGEGFRTIFNINSSESISTHGDGDYLMCAVVDGNPDTRDIWVVDGYLFTKIYEVLE